MTLRGFSGAASAFGSVQVSVAVQLPCAQLTSCQRDLQFDPTPPASLLPILTPPPTTTTPQRWNDDDGGADDDVMMGRAVLLLPYLLRVGVCEKLLKRAGGGWEGEWREGGGYLRRNPPLPLVAEWRLLCYAAVTQQRRRR